MRRVRVLAVMAGLVLALAAATGFAQAQKRVALVIGNSAYSAVARLPNPARDAKAVAASLKRLGFAVTLKLDLKQSALLRSLGRFARTAAGADIAVINYAGHGIEVGGQNYLIPTDAQLANAGDVDFEAVPLRTAMGALASAGKLKLVILDACRNNPFAARMARSNSSRSIGRGLARVEPRSGNTLVAYAAKGGTTADDGDGGHSPYTAALLRYLETPGLEIRLLFGKVRDSVLASTGRRQEPFTCGSLGGNAIYLVPGGTAGGAVDGGQTGGSRLDEARLAYNDAKGNESRRVSNGKFKVAIAIYPGRQKTRRVKPGSVFADCAKCPQMVVIPAGSFMMGSPKSEKGRQDDEGPQRRVTIPQPFAVGKFEVTFDEWGACVKAGGCNGYRPEDKGWGRGRRPVINVSWNDAKAYVKWLRERTGKEYRLLSEAEWEYVARGGKGRRKYWWGNSASHEYANYGKDECCDGLKKGRDKWKYTSPVGSFPANPFGLHDMHGNVWEWVEDCYQYSYKGALTNGKAWTTGSCDLRVLRGGSWGGHPQSLRSAYRLEVWPGGRGIDNGFRVARSLP